MTRRAPPSRPSSPPSRRPLLLSPIGKQALEDAIRDVEAGYASPEPDPFAELENVLAHRRRSGSPTCPLGLRLPNSTGPADLANDPVLAGSDADPEEWPALGPQVEDPAAEHPSVSFDEKSRTKRKKRFWRSRHAGDVISHR